MAGSLLELSRAVDGREATHERYPRHQRRSDSLTGGLDDPDEGNELERLTFQAFDHLCPFGTFHQPRVGEGRKKRELCDILAVSRVREQEDEGLFVIQSKAASVTPETLGRTDARRASSAQKNILCAVDQLRGAIRRLRAGDQIFRSDGTPVEVDPPVPELIGIVEPLNIRERASQVGHGIVLLSDMHPGVDWEEVARELIDATETVGYLCHILDLRELQRLVSHSAGRSAMLENYLTQRWQLMVQHKSALVRSEFIR